MRGSGPCYEGCCVLLAEEELDSRCYAVVPWEVHSPSQCEKFTDLQHFADRRDLRHC
jgi:hypothetical protein